MRRCSCSAQLLKRISEFDGAIGDKACIVERFAFIYFSLHILVIFDINVWFSSGSIIHTCDHCGVLFVGIAHRVTSEEDGVTLLDMVVCSFCAVEAKRLKLQTEKINIMSHNPIFRNPLMRRSRSLH
jgi:hypothetical protein